MSVGKYEDLTGKRFGRLTVVKRSGTSKSRCPTWLCKCDCGTEKTINGSSLKREHIKSCGCYRREYMRNVAISKTKHGHSRHPLAKTHSAMIHRCKDRSNPSYPRYGGRGIYVCDEWQDYETFFQWAMCNGYKEGLQIDRIDNDGPYAPWNCRFVTARDNMNNTSKCRKVICTNAQTRESKEYRSIAEAARETGCSETAIANAINGRATKQTKYIFKEKV